jgi:glycosyltransferase involved in cell wall biosynthesis
MVGEGDQEGELRKRIDGLGLENQVTIAGYLSGCELRDQYRAASLLVLPTWSEGFPTVLAEAMDAGLPIVTTKIRGAADHLVAGENALFVKPRDVKGLATAMTKLLRDDDLRARMASANRKRVRMFEPENVARDYLEVLQEAIRAQRIRNRGGPE